MFDSVRTKLTLWYTGVLAVALIGFSAGVYLLLAHRLLVRFDAGLRTAVEGTARSINRELAEGENELQAAGSALDELYFPLQAVAVFNAEGTLLAEKALPLNLHATLPARISSLTEHIQIFDQPGGGAGEPSSRLAAQRTVASPDGKKYLVVVSQSLDSLLSELELLREIFWVAAPLALALAGLGGWFLARKALAPIVMMSESARRIGAENLEQQLPVVNPRDELGQLAATFNELLARLNASFTQQRQFMADASHELRTPLSVIRTTAEVTLEQDCRAEGEYREALAMINEQTRRLTRIVEEMFTLARADAGRRLIDRRDFYLDELVAETARAANVLATRKGLRIEFGPAAETPYRGDEDLLRQMLLNLLDNAIRHTQPAGAVTIGLERAGSDYLITIADTGAGIPPEAQPHIFERFYRVDRARSRQDQSGAGLGLSIARWVAEAHGGRLELRGADERGSAFVASLPAQPRD